MTMIIIYKFKNELDQYLKKISDQPTVHGCIKYRLGNTNTIKER